MAVAVSVGDGDVVAVVDHRVHPGVGLDGDAAASVLAGQFLGDVGVFVGECAVGVLENLDVDAVAVEDVGEFHADSAGADDDDGLGYCGVEDLLFVGHDVLAEGDPGQHPHP